MKLPTQANLEQVAAEVYEFLQPTPQLSWPLLNELSGCELWLKHENHNPTGAFKVRGGLIYLKNLLHREPGIRGVVTATRGNHGQSIAFAATRLGLEAIVVVPHGNNPEKNEAMRALGATLVEHGRDFDEAVPHAIALAQAQGYHRIPSFHEDLVRGVASYSLEFLKAQPQLERVYVPIGLGSGICGMICARNALGLDTEIVGVVSEAADAYARSLEHGRIEATESADTLADGLAVRTPDPDALALMSGNVARVSRVSDDEVLAAMATLFRCSHNVAEGAGAAALAAVLKEREDLAGKRVGAVISGANADRDTFLRALAE